MNLFSRAEHLPNLREKNNSAHLFSNLVRRRAQDTFLGCVLLGGYPRILFEASGLRIECFRVRQGFYPDLSRCLHLGLTLRQAEPKVGPPPSRPAQPQKLLPTWIQIQRGWHQEHCKPLSSPNPAQIYLELASQKCIFLLN